MPTYLFECLQCERRFEIMRSIKDLNPVSCPDCAGEVRTIIASVPVFVRVNQKDAALNILEHHPQGRRIHRAADIVLDRWRKQRQKEA